GVLIFLSGLAHLVESGSYMGNIGWKLLEVSHLMYALGQWYTVATTELSVILTQQFQDLRRVKVARNQGITMSHPLGHILPTQHNMALVYFGMEYQTLVTVIF
ncbi:hypothetical protein MAR_019636, partial [Mya arenaria]